MKQVEKKCVMNVKLHKLMLNYYHTQRVLIFSE